MSTDAQRLDGKTVLLTGGTQGIGRAAASELARRGATLVVVGRDPARTEALVAAIREETGNARIEGLLADLSSQASVRKLSADFRARHGQLHVLVNNAGAVFTRRQLSVDGVEMTFALNHLAYFLLTVLLLDVLKASAPARVVNVASRAHLRGRLDFDDLQHEKRYRGMSVYGDSKLANVVFTAELARRLEGTGVTANCLHPGVVSSGFGKNTPGLFKLGVKLAAPFFITPERGAQTVVYLATSPEVAQVTGRYFARSAIARSHPAAQDVELGRRLWEVSEALTQPRPAPVKSA